MKYRFLLHSMSHTILAVNITGLSVNIAGVKASNSALPYIQFNSWDKAERHFRELGGGHEPLKATRLQLDKSSVAVLTII